jgi:hypothetical protein
MKKIETVKLESLIGGVSKMQCALLGVALLASPIFYGYVFSAEIKECWNN